MPIIHGDPDFLMHYGVLGMKWGVRRYQDKNGRLTSAGKEHYSKKKDKKEDETKEGFSMIAAMLGVEAVSMLGIVTVASIASASAKSRERREDKHRETLQKDPKTGLPIKDKEYTPLEDCRKVNPGFASGSNDTFNNCTMCSLAFDIRRRGFDVRAGKSDYGLTTSMIEKFYKNGKYENHTYKGQDVGEYYSPNAVRIRKNLDRKYDGAAMVKELREINSTALDDIAKQGDGARGFLSIRWMGGYSGHAVAYQVENGKTVIYDAQVGRQYKSDPYWSNGGVIRAHMRTDNIDPDYEYIKEQAYIV